MRPDGSHRPRRCTDDRDRVHPSRDRVARESVRGPARHRRRRRAARCRPRRGWGFRVGGAGEAAAHQEDPQRAAVADRQRWSSTTSSGPALRRPGYPGLRRRRAARGAGRNGPTRLLHACHAHSVVELEQRRRASRRRVVSRVIASVRRLGGWPDKSEVLAGGVLTGGHLPRAKRCCLRRPRRGGKIDGTLHPEPFAVRHR